MIEEEVVLVVVVAELLVSPEQDHPQVVVQPEAAPEGGQIGVAVRLFENLKKIIFIGMTFSKSLNFI